jgi:hypothetical protein
MKTIQFYMICLLVCLGSITMLKAQQSPQVNTHETCCNGSSDLSYGKQGDCHGGNPYINLPDTIPMSSLAPTVDINPEVYPPGGNANWSHGATTLSVSVSPGTYSVIYTTSPNCVAHDTTEVVAYANSISGSLFTDLDGNGQKAVFETFLPGQPVQLYNEALELIAETVTDLSGNYSFAGLKPNIYVVSIDSPATGLIVTGPGPDNVFDQVSRTTQPLVVGVTTTLTGQGGGLTPVTPSQISGVAWVDENRDGIQDPGEPPLPNHPVFITEFRGGLPRGMFTANDGTYLFDYLPPGGYFVQFPIEDNFPILAPNDQGGDDSKDSDFVPIPLTPPIAQNPFPIQIPAPGQQVQDVDCGFQRDTVVRVKIISFLSGAVRGNGEMGNELATGGLLPASEPYSGLGYGLTEGVGVNLLLTKVPDAVDYVVIELRDKNDSTQVVASRTGILKKNGEVVDECGETLTFKVPRGTYFVAFRHRNHLDIMTKFPVFLDDRGDFPIDFSDPNLPTTGIGDQKPLDDGRFGLWGGDASGDNELKYSGPNNDRGKILTIIGGTDPTTTQGGYLLEDVNMDGEAKYSGPDNDRAIILENIGGTDPTATKKNE